MRSTFLAVSVVTLFLLQGNDLTGQAPGTTQVADQPSWPPAALSGTSTPPPERIANLRRAAEGGDAVAQNDLGSAYAFGGGVERNNEEAAKWFALAAKAGLAEAQANLGYLYEKGWGVAQDYGAALDQYRAAAEGGNAQAQTRIGLFYEKGWVVPMDQREAVRWYRVAAERGDAAGQRKLGNCLYAGRGAPRD